MDRQNRADEEKKLVEKVLGGEKRLYRILVERNSPMVFYLIRQYVNDEEEVEELAQEVFVRTYEKLPGFDGKSAFSSWLYSVTRNRCLDYVKDIRRENSRFSEHEPEFLESQMVERDDPYRQLARKEQKSALEAAISRLSREQSEPLLMKYRDGCSYEVISRRLGVSVPALKVRVHRARKELMKILETVKSEEEADERE